MIYFIWCVFNILNNAIVIDSVLASVVVLLNCGLSFSLELYYPNNYAMKWMGACVSTVMVCSEESNDNQPQFVVTDAIISIADIMLGLLYFVIVFTYIMFKLFWLLIDELTFDYFRFNERFNHRYSLGKILGRIFYQKDWEKMPPDIIEKDNGMVELVP